MGNTQGIEPQGFCLVLRRRKGIVVVLSANIDPLRQQLEFVLSQPGDTRTHAVISAVRCRAITGSKFGEETTRDRRPGYH